MKTQKQSNHNNIMNNNNNNNKELQEVSDESPTSVIENNNVVEVERFSLPKSISVRSNGYLKMSQSAALAPNNNNATRNKGATRPRASATPPEPVVRTHVLTTYAFISFF